jgi:metal-sulfur cluster biosynthetic enzyme
MMSFEPMNTDSDNGGQPSRPQAPSTDTIFNKLRTVIDPEIGINVVDLGLIYEVGVEAGMVNIKFTLTNPMCPLAEVLAQGIRTVVVNLPGVEKCHLQLIMDPPWSPERISEEGRRVLAYPSSGI